MARSVSRPGVMLVAGVFIGMAMMAWIGNHQVGQIEKPTGTSVARADDALRSDQTAKDESRSGSNSFVASRKVQIGLLEYQLRVKNGGLELWSQNLGSEPDVKTANVKFDAVKNGVISEVLLTKWLRANLAAVIKITRDGQHEFYVACIASGDRANVKCISHKILTTREKYRILAANGDWGGDNLFAVLGRIDLPDIEKGDDAAARIGAGAFYVDFCPRPPVLDAEEFKLDGKSKR